MFQGEFGIPDELKEIVRHSSEAELTDFVLSGLKEAMRNPQQLSAMMPGMPPEMLAGLGALNMGDATLRPMAGTIARLLIQEVKLGKKLSEDEVRQAMMDTFFSPGSNFMGESLSMFENFNPEDGAIHDAPDELKEFLTSAANAQDAEEVEASLRLAYEYCSKNEPDSTWMLTVMENYSDILLFREKFPDAEQILKEWLKLGEKLLAKDHPSLSVAYLGLAVIRVTQNKAADAELLFNKAVELSDKGLSDPAKHAEVLSSAAEFFESQKLSKKSDPLFERSWGLMERALGDECLVSAEFAAERAVTLLERERFDQAEKWCQRSLAIKTAVLDSDDFDLLRSFVLLADIYLCAKKLKEAEELLVDTINKLEKLADPRALRHPLELLCEIYKEQGNETELQKLNERLKSIPDEGEDSED